MQQCRCKLFDKQLIIGLLNAAMQEQGKNLIKECHYRLRINQLMVKVLDYQ